MLKETSVSEEVDFTMHRAGGAPNACYFVVLGRFQRGLLELVNLFSRENFTVVLT